MAARRILLLAALGAGAATAQDLPPSKVPGSPPGFDFPMRYDSVRAAPTNHRVAYEDAHVRLIEVTLWPGIKEKMHGHAYPSVFADYQAQPPIDNDALVDKGPPPFGERYALPGAPQMPNCVTLGPQTPHAATVTADFPQHFFRLEFKHPQTSFARDWRRWYPELAAPPRSGPGPAAGTGGSLSRQWPYPIALDGGRAAPANFVKRFDDGLVRMYEVSVRPGETTPVHGSAYYAINAYPSPQPNGPGGATIVDRPVTGDTPRPAVIGGARAPRGLAGPTCTVTAPTAPHRLTNDGTIPLHFYRIEFLRVDGDDYPRNWRALYPAQAEGPPIISSR